MKIKEIKLKKFKRFTDLTITGLPESAKLILLVGPNGSGKSSVFEAFNHWYKLNGYSSFGAQYYYEKNENEKDIPSSTWYQNKVTLQVYGAFPTKVETKGKFYFRTAHRNDPDFVMREIKKQPKPTDNIQFDMLMSNDASVSGNYQRLTMISLSELYNKENDDKSVKQLRDELIGKIQSSLHNVFNDLELNSIADPIEDGTFYFAKGISKHFRYSNLSAGEKSAFDLILDLVIKGQYYPDAVLCIDEPEVHMHTALQAKLLEELYSLVPSNGQMWIATHSMGMLKKAKELEIRNPNSVVFLDFTSLDFDSSIMIQPSQIDKTVWKKFLELAFDEFSGLIAPERIVFCEGTPLGRKNQNFDAEVYSNIFAKEYPTTTFVSVGSCDDLKKPDNISMKIIGNILSASEKIYLIDRDDRSSEEIVECNQKGIKVLSLRHLEAYLLDDEILSKLCEAKGKPEKNSEVIQTKNNALNNSVIERGNPPDDIKSAAGEIVVGIKRILQLSKCGNTTHVFLRDTIAPLVTPETEIYQKLEHEIFDPISLDI